MKPLCSSLLSSEDHIVWEENVERFDYVRELVVRARTRQRAVPWHGEGRRVGYSVLSENASNDGWRCSFIRRLFFLKPYDRDSDPTGLYSFGAPAEAVDPRTVGAGRGGILTDRAWGADRRDSMTQEKSP